MISYINYYNNRIISTTTELLVHLMLDVLCVYLRVTSNGNWSR